MTRSTIGRGWALPAALGLLLVVQGCNQGQLVAGGGEPVAQVSGALTQDAVQPTGGVCAPTGKHAAHARFACATCHQCAGTLSFDPVVAGPSAAFDATTKNCSNVACHTVPAGTFTYNTYDWALDMMVPTTVPYGGPQGSSTANWYATAGAGCNACHGYPPTYNGVAYPWHSGAHGTTLPNGNTCQLCHPDATGAYVYSSFYGSSGGMISSCPTGTYCSAPGTITNPSLHGNGVVDVSAKFVTSCLGCH